MENLRQRTHMDTPITISLHEATRLSGLSRSFLYLQLASGAIRSSKIGKRRLIHRESLLLFINAGVATCNTEEGGDE